MYDFGCFTGRVMYNKGLSRCHAMSRWKPKYFYNNLPWRTLYFSVTSVTAWQAWSISKNILIYINHYSILILHSVLILNPLNPPRFFSNLKSRTYLKLVIRWISFWISRNGLDITSSLQREGSNECFSKSV